MLSGSRLASNHARRQQQGEARAPCADHPSDGRRPGNDGGRGRRRRDEGDGVALAGAVHAGGRGGPSSRQDAQAGDAPDVRGDGSRASGSGGAPHAGRGDVLDGACLGEDGRHPINKTHSTLRSALRRPAAGRPKAPPNPTTHKSAVEAPDSRGQIGSRSSESLDSGSRGRSSRRRYSKTEP